MLLRVDLLILGDALADGATIKWQYHKALEGLTEDEVEKISLEEIKGMEAECMEKIFGRYVMMLLQEQMVNLPHVEI